LKKFFVNFKTMIRSIFFNNSSYVLVMLGFGWKAAVFLQQSLRSEISFENYFFT